MGVAVTGYRGDVSSAEAWAMMQRDSKAVLIDVRTRAEWNYVGVPALDSLGRRPLLIEWQRSDGTPNPDFVNEVNAAVGAPDTTILFLCRSGARSRAAAIAATAAGYTQCVNVSDGFEGPRDQNGHRGTVTGWKAAGNPWVQE